MDSLDSDVFQSIIDELRDDKSTLATSCLVARSWLSVCQPCLFAAVRVYGYDPESETVEIDSFGEFLRKTPSICGHVHRLEIQARKPQLPSGPIMIGWARSIAPLLSFSACLAVISKLPNLLEVVVANATVHAERDFAAPFFPPQSFPSVVSLELSNIDLPRPSSHIGYQWNIIRPFCNLRSLRMIRLSGPPWSETQARLPSFPKLPLRHLVLHDADQGALLQNLLKMQCLLSITPLDVKSDWGDTDVALEDVLNQYSDQLRELAIYVYGCSDADESLRLGSCSRLHSITFSIAVVTDRPRPDNSAAWGAVIQTLFTVSSTLRRVVFNIDFSGNVGNAVSEARVCVDWERLEGVLESHLSLETVIVNTMVGGMSPRRTFREVWEVAHRVVDSHLARVSASGILQFTAPV